MGRDVLKNLGYFVILVCIDQISKNIGHNLQTYHLNYGIMLGLLKDSSFFFRLTTLSSIFGFLFSIYIILLYLLRTKLRLFKFGLTLLISGIFGNILDKIILGASVDFIPIDLFNLSIRLNIADIFQWAGAAIIIYQITLKEHLLWHPENKRSQFLLFKKEQIRFSYKITAAVLCSSLIFGIFCFSFVRAILLENKINAPHYFSHFTISYVFFTLIFGTIVFFSGLLLSHKTAGPIFAFIKHVNQLLDGERNGEFKLREGDNYRYLEDVAKKIQDSLKP